MLPSWLENIEEMSSASFDEPLPTWLEHVNDSLEAAFQSVDSIPDWLEHSGSLDTLFSDNFDHQDSVNDLQKSDHQDTMNPPPRLQSSSEVNGVIETSPLTTLDNDDEIDLLSSAQRAQDIGLGFELKLALDLDELTLTSPTGKARKLFGPLLLVLTKERLILVAYEGDQQRQRPWAFTAEQLVRVECVERRLMLSVEEERNITFELPTTEISRRAKDTITEWFQG